VKLLLVLVALTRAPSPTAQAGPTCCSSRTGPNFDFSTVGWWLGLPRPVGFLLVLIPCCAALVLAAQSILRANAISVSEPEG
jgi:hypothetical protein